LYSGFHRRPKVAPWHDIVQLFSQGSLDQLFVEFWDLFLSHSISSPGFGSPAQLILSAVSLGL
jgi:hypothetical protein